MLFFKLLTQTAGIVFIAMILLWLLSLRLRNASIVDIFWGSGFVLLAWLYFLQAPSNPAARAVIVIALVTIWGLRLSLHIFWRNRGKGEDFRYAAWRKEAGEKWWWQSFLKVFLLQGVLLMIISAPLLVALRSASPDYLTWLDFAGIALWSIGFFFEAVGDWQLTRFKSRPQNKGKLLTDGLWRYTRHPNYFGDAMIWWGYFLLATSAGGLWTIYSPLLMHYLLLKVSGVAMLEKTLSNSKPGYEEYIAKTNAFLPWSARK